MELVLRHAQNFMPPSQIQVVCLNSGTRYRWWSFLCLMILLLTGWLLVIDLPQPVSLETSYGIMLAVVCTLWVVQITILALLSFRIHPDLHLRVSSSMNAEEIKLERRRVGAAIVNMNFTVRLELLCALLAMLSGASLHLL